jgi:hypothetical protein
MPPTRVLRALTAACVLAAAVLPVTAAASVQVGSSGWRWGNPLPQGNTLRAMSFAPGGTGYAAGEFGPTRAASITVTGRLQPAVGNERVTVSYRAPGSVRWSHQTVKTAANGTFTTSRRVGKGDNEFVAQWPGDFRSAGDGSVPLTVTVSARRG